MQQLLASMCDLALRHAGRDDTTEIAPGASLFVSRAVTRPAAVVYQPMLCLVLQGAKQVMIGEQILRYDPAQFFIASVELPVSGYVVEASADRPYVCASLSLDRAAIVELLAEVPVGPDGQTTGFAVSPVTRQMLDPWSRLLALFEAPGDIPVMAPMLKREILYRLLQGPQAGVLRQIARADSRLSQVRLAVDWIRTHFDEPLRVEALAEIAGMSPAVFHRHFKAATALSPLQYQKRLRLQEARRLMVSDAGTTRTAYRVGYESPSQFSREHARMFGVPPSRDAERLRGLSNDFPEAGGGLV
jgi:AraC-like DNA-binding protein